MFERDFYKKAFDSADTPLVVTDSEGNILEVSSGFMSLMEIESKDSLIGNDIKHILGVDSIGDDFHGKRSIKGKLYSVTVKKFNVEDIDFYLISFIREEQLRDKNPYLALLRDFMESGLEVENFSTYIKSNLNFIKNSFKAECAIFASRIKTRKPQFRVVLATNNCRDTVNITLQNIPEELSLGNVMKITSEGGWGEIQRILQQLGYSAAYALGINLRRNELKFILILFYKKPGLLDPGIQNSLNFLSYILTYVYQNAELRKELRTSAYRDIATKTYTQILMKEFVELQFYEAKRYGMTFSLMLIKVKNYGDLKKIFGSVGVDIIMHKIANQIMQSIRKSDVMGRYTEDSFLILLPFTDGDSMQVVVSRIIDLLKSTTFPPAKNVKFSLSFTNFSEKDTSYTELLKRLKETEILIE